MSAPAFKKIANPQNNLGMIEGLAQKICGPGLERAPFRFFVRVRGQNNYRQKALPVFGAQRFENGKAIRRRHHQIEQNQIRAKFFAELEDKLGIPYGLDTRVIRIQIGKADGPVEPVAFRSPALNSKSLRRKLWRAQNRERPPTRRTRTQL